MDGSQKFTIRSFMTGSDKEAALKPLEAAVEVYGAWQGLDACLSIGEHCNGCESDRGVRGCVFRSDLADEIADCMTACLNLAERYDLDMAAAVERCEQRNREQGRYPLEAEGAGHK